MLHYYLMKYGNKRFISKHENLNNAKKIIEDYDLTYGTRKQKVVYNRQYLMWYLRKHCKFTFEEIGSLLNKNHSTILYGCRQVEQSIEIDDKVYLGIIESFRKDLELRFRL